MKEEHKQKDIEIYRLDKRGERTPRFGYRSKHFGQTYYIAKKCKEEGIATSILGKDIQIYAQRKVIRFRKIIEESLIWTIKDPPKLKEEATNIWNGKALVCVLIKGKAYVTEGHMEELILNIFKRNLPRVSDFKIFRTKKELTNYLLNVEKVLV